MITLDLPGGLGSSVTVEQRAIETSWDSGWSGGRRIEDRPPRRWKIALAAEPHHRAFGYVRSKFREALGPVLPISWTAADGIERVVRLVSGTLTISMQGPGRAEIAFEVEEAFGL